MRRDTSQHGVFMTCQIMYNDMCSSAHTSSYYFFIESKKAKKIIKWRNSVKKADVS